MRVLVIGESCKDVFNYGACYRMCPEAPVPVFNSIRLVENGGMAMNVYNNLLSMGEIVDIKTNPNWNSITKTRFVDTRTNHMFMRLDNNDKHYGVCDIETIDLGLYDAVIASDYNKGYLTEKTLEIISNKSKLSFLDSKKILGPWAENFSFIKINNFEYEKTKHTITDKLSDKLIVTRGPRGCEYQGRIYSVDPVEVKDTSGAGDTFIAAVCSAYSKNQDIKKSLIYANYCSTKVVQKKGIAVV
tara:strand:+ start:187 stop:918 length:732 start_codon:yes stop_codon:yes gene_type:complete